MVPKADTLKRTNEMMAKRLTFKPDIDVRGQRGEALANIQSFIDRVDNVASKNPQNSARRDTGSLGNYP